MVPAPKRVPTTFSQVTELRLLRCPFYGLVQQRLSPVTQAGSAASVSLPRAENGGERKGDVKTVSFCVFFDLLSLFHFLEEKKRRKKRGFASGPRLVLFLVSLFGSPGSLCFLYLLPGLESLFGSVRGK